MAGQGDGRQIAAREIASEAIPAGVVVSGRSISKLRAQGCASDATLWNILVRLFGDTGPVAILDVNSCKKCSKEIPFSVVETCVLLQRQLQLHDRQS